MGKMKLLIVAIFGVLIIFLTECKTKPVDDFNSIPVAEKRDVVLVIREKGDTQYIEPLPETILKDDEKEVLARVVHAEAENQDMTGKRLVVDCVLNRVDSGIYPNHVWGVVLQEGQFVRAETYTADDMAAVEKELKERLDYNVMYFRTRHYHDFGTALYQHGDHYFSGR